MNIILLIIGLLLFVGLVVVHEFGHFIAARRGGVEVEEFGIGFPPKAWGKKLKSGLLFTINWLPLGGFVKLKGESDSATAKGSFGAAPLKVKIKIMLAGVGMNLLTAFVLLTLLALLGMPKVIPDQFTVAKDTKTIKNQVFITSVEKDSPAEKAGVKSEDRLIDVFVAGNQIKINSAVDLTQATKRYAGQKAELKVERNGKETKLNAQLRSSEEVEKSKKTDNPKGYLGVAPGELTIQRSTWSAPIVGLGLIKQLTIETFKGLGKALTSVAKRQGKQASEMVAGPLGIFFFLKNGSELGYQYMLFIIAILSLTLAIMNALPIPALDGGRLFVTLLYRKVLKKPLTQEREEKIHGTGFAVLMLLFLVITFVDIKRIF